MARFFVVKESKTTFIGGQTLVMACALIFVRKEVNKKRRNDVNSLFLIEQVWIAETLTGHYKLWSCAKSSLNKMRQKTDASLNSRPRCSWSPSCNAATANLPKNTTFLQQKVKSWKIGRTPDLLACQAYLISISHANIVSDTERQKVSLV